jgi:hypothetical protein
LIAWEMRPREERALLNAAFSASLLWHAASGYSATPDGALSFEESFLVLPLVLHRVTRETLPRDTRTSLAVWLQANPLARGRITTRARMLVPFTKEALTFGGVHGLLNLGNGQVRANSSWRQLTDRTLRESSAEVRHCASRAEFLGRWFGKTGSSATVLALIGVRP